MGRLAVVATKDAELAAGSGAGVILARNVERAAAASGRADAARPGRETGMLRGFKNFLMQGDLIIIAVGLVVALAFAALIQAFVDNIITPLVNAAGGGAAGEGLGWTINGQRIDLGAFIGASSISLFSGCHLLRARGALPGLHAAAGDDRVRRAGTHQDLPGMPGIRSARRSHSVQVLRPQLTAIA